MHTFICPTFVNFPNRRPHSPAFSLQLTLIWFSLPYKGTTNPSTPPPPPPSLPTAGGLLRPSPTYGMPAHHGLASTGPPTSPPLHAWPCTTDPLHQPWRRVPGLLHRAAVADLRRGGVPIPKLERRGPVPEMRWSPLPAPKPREPWRCSAPHLLTTASRPARYHGWRPRALRRLLDQFTGKSGRNRPTARRFLHRSQGDRHRRNWSFDPPIYRELMVANTLRPTRFRSVYQGCPASPPSRRQEDPPHRPIHNSRRPVGTGKNN
jgi:hypothetical protein